MKSKFINNARAALSSIGHNDIEIIYSFLYHDSQILHSLKNVLNNTILLANLNSDISTKLQRQYSVNTNVINAIMNMPPNHHNWKQYLNTLSQNDLNDLVELLDYVSQIS